MKANFGKRVLSIVLCTLMLFSCWVFTAPSANAADTSATINNQSITAGTTEPTDSNAKGQYKVRIMLCEDTESGGGFIGIGKWYKRFDKSVHDYWGGIGAHKTEYIDGLVYSKSTTQSNGNAKRNISGTEMKNDLDANGNNNPNNNKNWKKYPYWCEWAQICYKNTNGTGDSGSVWFNIGDADATGRHDVVSDQGHDYGYFPSDEGVLINGFPTSFTTRMYEQSGSDPDAYYAYLQIATWNSSTKKWEWSGNNGGNGTLASSTEKSDGTNYRNGIASVHPGTDSGNGAVELKATATVANSAYPTAKSTSFTPAYASSTKYAPGKEDASDEKNTLSYNEPVDQYGVTMVHTISVKTTATETVGPDGLSQSGKITSVGFNMNIPGTTNDQTITATLKWPYKNSNGTNTSFSKTASFKLYDAQYTVKFKDASGNTIQNGSSGDLTRTVYYGSNANAPAASTYAKKYDTTNHYTFNKWDPSNTNVTEDRICVPQYNEIPHTMVDDDTIDGYVAATCTEAGVQTKKCSGCAYTDTEPINALGHSWGDVKSYQAEDNTSGYTYYECSRCEKFCPAAIDEGAYVPNPGEDYENVVEEASSVEAKTDKIPAPFFNDNNGSAQFYDNVNYSERPASFKYDLSSDLQTMRFAGSVKVPEGVSWEVGSQDDNVVIDFGFVYTQTKYICNCVDGKYQVVETTDEVFDDDNKKIGEYSYLEYPTADPSRLVYDFNTDEPLTDKADIGKEGYKIYKMSVVNPGSGVTRPANGYSHHDIGSAGSEAHYLSFNLVISVKQSNWEKEYSARPYIRYKYHGNVYTVYDGGASNMDANLKYSHRSVMELADDIICYDPFDEESVLPSFVNSYRTTYGVNPSYSTYLAWVGYLRNDKDFAQNKFYNLNQLDEDEQAALINIKFYSIGWITTFDVDYFLDPDQSLQDDNYKDEDWYNLVLSSI